MNPRTLMNLAIWLLPPNRKDWGEAMRGEFETIEDGQMPFAFGCFRSSCKENIGTSEGIARLGFLVLFTSAAVSAGMWLWSWKAILTSDKAGEFANLSRIGWWLTLGFVPIAIGYGAIQAMRAPTDRHYLATTGTKMVSTLAIIWGGSAIVGTLGIFFNCYSTPRCAEVGSPIYIAGYYGVFLTLIGILAQQNARLLRDLSFFGLVFSVALTALFFWGIDSSRFPVGEMMVATLVPLLPLLMMTVAGTLFTRMQRHSIPTPQV